MNIYDHYFLSLIIRSKILRRFLNPSGFISLLVLVVLCYASYLIGKFFKERSILNEVIFDPEQAILKKSKILLFVKYILSIVVLFIFTLIIIGFINLIIMIMYSFGGIVFETGHLNTINGPETDIVSFQSILQVSWIFILFYLKVMIIIPSLFKLFINSNYILGYKNPKYISSFAVIYILSIVLLQIINDHDEYLHISFLSVFLWISSLVTFGISLSQLKYEIDTFKNKYPLRSFSFFITQLSEFEKNDIKKFT